jgi:outer membrane lipoprotein-sorting protein
MKLFATFVFLSVILISPARAQATGQSEILHKVESYLNNLQTAKARFVQTAYDGSQVIGTFYLDRPGKLRFEYDDPIEDFIVADGFLIYFYDSQLEEQSNAPIGSTLADFILRPELKLTGDIEVTNIRDSDNMLQVSMVQADEPEAGSLTLGFNSNPFQLKKWRVTDSMGSITEIELFQMQTDIHLDDNLFIYSSPQTLDKNPYKFNE